MEKCVVIVDDVGGNVVDVPATVTNAHLQTSSDTILAGLRR